MEHIVQTKAICKAFGKHFAVDHVSMTVGRGDIYGLTGENGAGKTTFMRMVCGHAAPTSGDMRCRGIFDSGKYAWHTSVLQAGY